MSKGNLIDATLIIFVQHIFLECLLSVRTSTSVWSQGCNRVEGLLPSTTMGVNDCPVPFVYMHKHVKRAHSPCHSLLLSTSHLHPSSCKSSPHLLSARTVLAYLLHRSHNVQWQCLALSDLTLWRNEGESMDLQVNNHKNLIRWMLSMLPKCTAMISLQTSDNGRGA